MEWAAPASGGGMTLLQSLALSGASVTSSTFSSAYVQILIYVKGAYASTGANTLLRINGDTGNNYAWRHILADGGGLSTSANLNTDHYQWGNATTSSTPRNTANSIITITRPSDTDQVFIASQTYNYDGSAVRYYPSVGVYDNSAAVTNITFLLNGGSYSGGTAEIYGVK